MGVDVDLLFPYAAAAGVEFTERLVGQRPLFVCVIASTDTALVPGISAAGVSAELIPFTAAADAEVLAHGSARCIPGVPSNPLGPPGPSIITLAALQLADIPHLIVNAGCRVGPDAPCVDLGGWPGGHIVDGRAVPDAAKLFDRARDLGMELAAKHPYLVIGESVPGGTTTALAVLLALGIAADGRVSSSMAANAHGLKSRIAREALARLPSGLAARDPLGAVAVLGDPMQAAAAGIAAGALDGNVPVLLAGGSQMVAVLALLRRIEALGRPHIPQGSVAVGTTRWVVDDPTADVVGLMGEVGGGPLIATTLSFADSSHAALRRYEDFLVKEGVGAGGAAIAATLCAGITCAELLERTERIYERVRDGAPVPTP
ncbi:MAG: hypothetical protein HW416_3163 [Chloroflexi bacterium]|nr:hypothetical protein [Chloroflexota bacterium]